MDAPAQPIPDLLRLENCPACTYALTGLPAVGVCPECGESYDTETVELAGKARGMTHVNSLNASSKQFRQNMLVYGLIGITFYVLAILFLTVVTRSSVFLILMLILSCPLLTPAIRLLRRCFGERVQSRVRMNRSGIVQDDDPQEPPAAAIIRVYMPLWGVLGMLALVLWLCYRGQWVLIATPIFASMSLFAQINRRLQMKRKLKRVPDGHHLTPVNRRWSVIPYSWQDVQTIHIGSVGDDVCRIVTSSQIGGKYGAKGDITDIDVTCTPAAAEELRARVAAWRQLCREAEDEGKCRSTATDQPVHSNPHDGQRVRCPSANGISSGHTNSATIDHRRDSQVL